MPLILFLVAMVALWLFIRHDQRKLSEKPKPIDRENFKHGYTPALAAKWQVPAGVSLIFCIGAVLSYFEPLAPPFAGKWAWAQQSLYSLLGPYGAAIAFSIGAVLFAYAATVGHRLTAQQRRKQNAA